MTGPPRDAVDPSAVPNSGCDGILWPATPRHADAALFALMYQLEDSQWWPAETLLAHQLDQLEGVIAHAAQTVPFYGDRLKVLSGVKPGALTIEALRRVPVLGRTDIQDAGDALVSTRMPKDHGAVTEVRTSGSTGRPITVKTTAVSGLFFRALNLRHHLWHGRDFAGKSTRITRGRAADDDKPGGWIPGYPSGPMVAFPVTRPTDEQLAWLAAEDPEYLLTYPSNLRALLERAGETGVRPAALREAATIGEILDPDVRELCNQVWVVPVVDAYSSMELGMIALQCPGHAHYHVQAENLLVEVLGDDGEPCAPGEVGRVVITDLHNFASPLIRYDIGDYAEAGGSCPCGRGLPVLNRIVGRTRDMLVLPSGERLWPVFSKALRDTLPNLRQAQLVQRTRGEVDVLLAVASPLTPENEARVVAALREALTDAVAYRLVYVDDIPRTPGGKFFEFKSELGAEA
jgi:phenylacetate-CoA ligase